MTRHSNNSAISRIISGNIKDLISRIFFTIIILIIYRIGVHIPIPFVRPEVVLEILERNSGGLLGALDMFSGGAIGNMSIMTLGLMPYISASIAVQLLCVISPHFAELRKHGGEIGKKTLNKYTKYLTVALGIFQSFTVTKVLEMTRSEANLDAVFYPGLEFKLITIMSFVTGTLFLVWLGERISNSGIGNGSSMIIYTGIVANLPASAIRTLSLGREGVVSHYLILAVFAVIVSLIIFVVIVEKSFVKVNVDYAMNKSTMGRSANSAYSYMPMKLNQTGVLAPIFASMILGLPQSVIQMFSSSSSKILVFLTRALNHGHPLFIFMFLLLIFYFSFMYTPIAFNVEETAEEMKKNRTFISGYRPGPSTVKFFDALLNRLTLLGACYMCIVCIVPEVITNVIKLRFQFGGTSILIVVGVSIDLVMAVRSRLAGEYSELINKPWMSGVQSQKRKY